MTKTDKPLSTDSISDAALEKQIRRLRGFHKFVEMADELQTQLHRHAHSDEHASRILDHIIETRKPNSEGITWCPTPAEMIEYANKVPADKPAPKPAIKDPDPQCSTCHGTGWEIVERGGRTGAERCRCRG